MCYSMMHLYYVTLWWIYYGKMCIMERGPVNLGRSATGYQEYQDNIARERDWKPDVLAYNACVQSVSRFF